MFNETAYNLALGAGCSSEGATVAAAIAQAESGGNPGAHNPTPPDDSYGLWQINMLGRLGPARRALFGLTSNDQLYDPDTNARAMYSISGGCQNFNSWTTFTHGTYRNYLPVGGSSPGGSSSAPGPDSSGGDEPGAQSFFDTLTMPIDFFSGAPAWLPLAAIVAAAYFLMK